MIETYSRPAETRPYGERLLPYELLYGSVALRMTAAGLASPLRSVVCGS